MGTALAQPIETSADTSSQRVDLVTHYLSHMGLEEGMLVVRNGCEVNIVKDGHTLLSCITNEQMNTFTIAVSNGHMLGMKGFVSRIRSFMQPELGLAVQSPSVES